MPLYFFRISHGRYAGASDQGSEFESREAAWTEMTNVCGNLLGSLSRSLKQNAEWQMELLDEAKKPVFRIRLVAESISYSVFQRSGPGSRQENASK
jgi:Domain of unknown function (DUF6894)